MRVEIIQKDTVITDGTARYVDQLQQGLAQKDIVVSTTIPRLPGLVRTSLNVIRRLGPDIQSFLKNYPLAVSQADADLYHIPAQTMATLLHTKRFHAPVVVTVLDIIPYLVRDNPELNSFRHSVDERFYKWALSALQKADHLLAISHYTRQTLIDTLGIAPDKITVTHLAVDPERFSQTDVPEDFYQRYGLQRDSAQYLLYVGSDDPRKNLKALIRALKHIRHERDDVVLLKVGHSYFSQQHQRIQALINELSLSTHIRFVEHVPDGDLRLFYNAASLLVMPSLYEGFGFPVIESMMCGTPAIASRASSLPELVPNETMLFDPEDPKTIADLVLKLLDNPGNAQAYINWAQQFSVESTIMNTKRVYDRLLL